MAIDMKKSLGRRISEQRQALGFTQQELAAQVGFKSSETISQIELGKREVKAWELAKLAQKLFLDVSDLLAIEKSYSRPTVLWRVEPSNQQAVKEAKFLRYCEQYFFLETISRSSLRRSFPQKKVYPSDIDYKDAERLADEIRSEFGLGDRPATVLEKTLENKYGVKIWYEDMDEGSAASTIGPFGPAILMNKKEAPWRRNYNFAHEVFHLITWDSIPPKIIEDSPYFREKIEKIANYFASCLLLPANSVIIEIEDRIVDGKIEYSDLVEIARKFDVSTEALLYRFLNLRIINRDTVNSILNDDRFRSLDRASMRGYWCEPPQLPERYVILAFVAYQKGRISRAKLARLLDVNLSDVEEIMQKYGLDLDDRNIQTKIEVSA